MGIFPICMCNDFFGKLRYGRDTRYVQILVACILLDHLCREISRAGQSKAPRNAKQWISLITLKSKGQKNHFRSHFSHLFEIYINLTEILIGHHWPF